MRFLLPFLFVFLLAPAGARAGDSPSGLMPLPPPAFPVDQRRSDPRRPARPDRTRYRGPIVDAHVHVFAPRGGEVAGAYELKKILRVMEEAGVERAVFMPTPNDARVFDYGERARLRRALQRLGGGRILRFCGGYLTYRLFSAYRDPSARRGFGAVLARLSKDLGSGRCAGVGELGVYHFDKTGGQLVVSYPPNFAPLQRAVDRITARGLWLDLHAEPVDPEGVSYEKKVFGGVELMFRRHPALKLILSHTAMTNPANARRLLRRYPRLMMNIKIQRKHRHWVNLEPVVNPGGALYEDWARLFEEMPRRFLVGTDSKFLRWRGGELSFPIEKYRRKIRQMRRLLGALAPGAAGLIAHGNARRMFGGPGRGEDK